jgi:hypothetical protein
VRILLTKWGILRWHPILDFYISWDFVKKAIDDENYIVSSWLFKNLPRFFKQQYVVASLDHQAMYVVYFKSEDSHLPRALQSTEEVAQLIKVLEDVEGKPIPDDKKRDLLAKSGSVIFNYKQV